MSWSYTCTYLDSIRIWVAENENVLKLEQFDKTKCYEIDNEVDSTEDISVFSIALIILIPIDLSNFRILRPLYRNMGIITLLYNVQTYNRFRKYDFLQYKICNITNLRSSILKLIKSTWILALRS